MKLTREQIQKEIEEMDKYVPVSKIEENLGMPPTTLQKVLSGKRELPKKWYKPLETYFVREPEKKQIDKKEEKTEDEKMKTSGSPQGAFMNEAIKKKLGIK